MSNEADPQVRYRFGPLERRGLIAGWRGGQIAAVAVGLVVGMIAIRSDASIGGAVLAIAAVGAGVAVATWPVKGRTIEEWAPDAVRYATRPSVRPKRGRADPFAYLSIVPVDLARDTSNHLSQSPAGEAAVIIDRAARTYTAAFSARSSGFVLLSERDKSHRVATWASVLASLARDANPVHRVQWICRTIPSAPHPTSANGSTPAVSEAKATATATERAVRSYQALIDSSTAGFNRHEVVIAIKVRQTKAKTARSIRVGSSEAAGCTAILREAAALRRRLVTAGIEADPTFPRDLLGRFIRSSLDRCPETSQAGWPWPMTMKEEWNRVLVDGTWHRTYWIAEWPRLEVGPDFLGPMLLLRDVRHSVSMVMEPMSPASAVRKLEQARTADVADAELRRRGGFLATARRRREEQLLEQREVELADGHAPFRFSGYVTVSAGDCELLEEHADAVEQAAARSGIELRICYGDQRRAISTALPLCRGLG